MWADSLGGPTIIFRSGLLIGSNIRQMYCLSSLHSMPNSGVNLVNVSLGSFEQYLLTMRLAINVFSLTFWPPGARRKAKICLFVLISKCLTADNAQSRLVNKGTLLAAREGVYYISPRLINLLWSSLLYVTTLIKPGSVLRRI